MSDVHALLIAVDYYAPHVLEGGITYPSLGGCVRDVQHVEAYLMDRLRLRQDQLIKLTASDGGGTAPLEPPAQQPTYANMILAFRELRDRARAGDQVYIHYSGHGGRARTVFPQLKTENGFDEGLVPTDMGGPRAQYLRDIELAYLIDELLFKDVHLTVVFDSCHSGGTTRGVPEKKAIKRGIERADTTERTFDSLVAPMEALVAAWQRHPHAAATRAANERAASGWLLEPKGYTFLAACRSSESAMEYPFSGQESNGALTYWMLDTLRHTGPGWSYKMLHDRVLAKVHGQFVTQTPQLQGDGERAIFGSDRIPTYHAVRVLQAKPDQVELQAGEVHGIERDDRFALYPAGSTEEDFATAEKRIGLAKVVTVAAAERCWATLEPDNTQNARQVKEGDQAVLLQSVRLQRTVELFEVDDAQLVQRFNEAVEQHGANFVKPAKADDNVDFQVTINQQNEWEICDPAGVPIPNLRPALRVDNARAPEKLVKRIVHLSKYDNVLSLPAPDNEVRKMLQVDLLGDRAPAAEGGTPVFYTGEHVTLRVKNLLTPGAANDAARILNICILNLASDWSVTQIYPSGTGDFHPLDPSDEIDLSFEATLPEGQEQSLDVIKVFAAHAATSFRWLELPALDQPDTRAAATRSAVTDPLQQMFTAITGPSAQTRTLSFVGGAGQKSWTLAQVELRVERDQSHSLAG